MTNRDSDMPIKRTEYRSKFNYWLLLPIGIVPFMIFFPIILSNMNPDMKGYEEDFQKVIDNKKAQCIDLQLIANTSGHGLWSLDPTESKLRDEAQNRLDSGDCKK